MKLEKILTFIVKDNKLLLLKGSSDDPMFKKSLWYTVTGGKEIIDNTLLDTVKREVKEETNLDVYNIIDLNWCFEYNALGEDCIEHAFLSHVNGDNVILNEENVEYMWCELNEFIDKIDWFYDKKELKEYLVKGIL